MKRNYWPLLFIGIFSFAFSIACLLFIVGIYAGRTYQVSDINENLNNYEFRILSYIYLKSDFLVSDLKKDLAISSFK